MNNIPADKPTLNPSVFSKYASNFYSHLILILLVELAAYTGMFFVYFLSDDFNLLIGTSRWLTPAAEFFRPIPHLLVHLFYKLFGMNVFPYHVLSFLIHYGNAVLIYLILRKTEKNNYVALAGSLFFAANFLISEAVFWISAVTTLLVTLFYLLTVYCYINFLSKLQKKYYALALISFVLGLLTKENAVTLPVVLILVHFYYAANPATADQRTINRTLRNPLPGRGAPEGRGGLESIPKNKNSLQRGTGGMNLRSRLIASFKGALPFIVAASAYLAVKASSLSAAVSDSTLALGYHNVQNVRHCLLSLFTFNSFSDLPFIFVDVKIMNLFFSSPTEIEALAIDFKFFTTLIIGTAILLFCLYLIIKGKKNIKFAFWAFLISIGPFAFVPSIHIPFRGHYMYPLRIYYLPAAFFYMFFALLLFNGFNRLKKRIKSPRPVILLVVLIPAIIIFSDVLKVGKRSVDWQTAGTVTQRVLGHLDGYVSDSPEETTLVLFNLPDSYRGVYIFRNGLQSAVKLLHPGAKVKIEIAKVSRQDYKISPERLSKENIVFIDCDY